MSDRLIPDGDATHLTTYATGLGLDPACVLEAWRAVLSEERDQDKPPDPIERLVAVRQRLFELANAQRKTDPRRSTASIAAFHETVAPGSEIHGAGRQRRR